MSIELALKKTLKCLQVFLKVFLNVWEPGVLGPPESPQKKINAPKKKPKKKVNAPKKKPKKKVKRPKKKVQAADGGVTKTLP